MSATARTAHAAPALRDARTAAAHLAELLSVEHGAMVEFLLALAAFDEARGWAELGHASLFVFLVRQLKLSKSAAYHRAAAARLIHERPAVAEALRRGRLCLSSAAELAKVLTAENEATVLPRFYGLSAREARDVVAELAPHPSPPARDLVRAVATVPSRIIPSNFEVVLTSEPPRDATQREDEASPGTFLPTSPATAPATATARPADAAEPLTADLRRLHVTVSRRFLQKLEAARGARAHARPGATTEAILEEALDLLLAREEKRRTAATSRPRHAPALESLAPEPAPRHRLPPGERRDPVPAEVRREVWARDGGRCAWPVDCGGICGSTHRLELDHVVPVGGGGRTTAANLRILCESHNKEAARRHFGAAWMERARSGGGQAPGP